MRWKFSITVLFIALIFVGFLYTNQDGITGQVSAPPPGKPTEPVCSDTNLQLLYHFNKDSGFDETDELVNDFSFNDKKAVCAGTQCPTHDPSIGKFPGSFNFDGSDDNFKVDNYNFQPLGFITIEAWVKPDPGGSGLKMIVWGGDLGGDGFGSHNEIHLYYNYDDQKFGFFIEGKTPPPLQGSSNDCEVETIGQNPNPPGSWYHVVGRINPPLFGIGDPTCEVFVNGQSASLADSFSGYDGSNNVNYIYIGRPDNYQFQPRNWDGFIDELVLYSDGLTNNEILNNYNSQAEHCPATCGNGIWEGGTEECDDGNLADGDGCSSICEIEDPDPAGGDSCQDDFDCSVGQSCVNGECVDDLNSPPIGWHDFSDCSFSGGWTCDPNDFSQPIDVHLYVNTSSGLQIIGTTKANLTREPAVGNVCGGNRDHGFMYNMSNSIIDLRGGNTYAVYTFAINIPPDPFGNPLLFGTPKIITCAPDPLPPVLHDDIPDIILVKDNSFSDVFDLDDHFSDPNGDSLVYDFTNTTPHVEISIDSNGYISFVTDDWIGLEYVVFNATDGDFVVESNNVTLNITDENQHPVIDTINPIQGVVNLDIDQSQTFSITKSDPDGNQLFVSWKLDNSTIVGATGDSYTYTSNFERTQMLTVVVSDTLFDDSFAWTINVGSQQPTQQLPPSQTGFCGDGKRDIGEDCSSCSVDVICSINSVCRSGVCVPIKEEEAQGSGSILFNLFLIIIIIFLILAILIIGYHVIRKRMKKKPQEPKKTLKPQVRQQLQNTKELENYIRKALATGKTRDQLEITLLATGWSKASIDNAFANVGQAKFVPTTQLTKPLIRRVKNINALIDYLNKVKARGYTRQQIEPVLLKKGWPKDVIDEAFLQAK